MQHTQTLIIKRAKKRKASGSSKLAGNSLLNYFPYNRFTLVQIEKLFSVYHIVLGNNTHDKELIISANQNMDIVQFEQLLHYLDYQNNNNSRVTYL